MASLCEENISSQDITLPRKWKPKTGADGASAPRWLEMSVSICY